jgi:hypothetical protein
MKPQTWRSLTWGALGVMVLQLGCLDSIVRTLAPVNDPQVVNTPTSFRFTATDLENVSDQISWVWTNSAPQAAFKHNTFIHHGYGIVMITDGVGQMVDSTLLEPDLETETRSGTAGDWTITLMLAGARGRVDFTLTPKP